MTGIAGIWHMIPLILDMLVVYCENREVSTITQVPHTHISSKNVFLNDVPCQHLDDVFSEFPHQGNVTTRIAISYVVLDLLNDGCVLLQKLEDVLLRAVILRTGTPLAITGTCLLFYCCKHLIHHGIDAECIKWNLEGSTATTSSSSYTYSFNTCSVTVVTLLLKLVVWYSQIRSRELRLRIVPLHLHGC